MVLERWTSPYQIIENELLGVAALIRILERSDAPLLEVFLWKAPMSRE
jgi:hypothetical protein